MNNWDNKEYVLEHVKNSGISLMFASDKLRSDKEVVLSAVSSDGIAFFYANNNIKDKQFALECATISHLCLCGVDPEYFNDYKWVKDCLQTNPKTFFIISKYLNYASDLQLCLFACKDYTTLSVMDKSLFLSQDFAEKLINSNPLTFKILSLYSSSSGPYNKNKDLIKLACQKNGFCCTFISESLLKDINFVAQLIKLNSSVYYHLPTYLKLEVKLALLAITDNAEIIFDVPNTVCTPKFLAKAIEANPQVFDLLKNADKNEELVKQLNSLNIQDIDKYVVACAKTNTFNYKIIK